MRVLKYFYLVCTVFFVLSCESQKFGDDNIVAVIGDESISFNELQKSLILNPQYSRRIPLSVARKSQLQYLVEKTYYYLAAKKINYEANSTIISKIKYIEKQETLRGFIEKKFLDAVEIEELELLQALAKFNKILYLQQLFTKDKEEAKRLEKRLIQGEKFEDLASELNDGNYQSNEDGESEVKEIEQELRNAVRRGIKVVMFSFTKVPQIGMVFSYDIDEKELEKVWNHKLILLRDREELIMGEANRITRRKAAWTYNKAILQIAANHIILDITLFGIRTGTDVSNAVIEINPGELEILGEVLHAKYPSNPLLDHHPALNAKK
jgi:hypothetical protein